MEYPEIEIILNSYLEGNSTLAEESILEEYFNGPDVAPHHDELRQLFRYYREARKESAPAFDVSSELNSLIEAEWKKETRHRFRSVIAWVGSAAALFILAFGMYRYTREANTYPADTFKDPKLAYLETKKALLLVSRTMNHNTVNLQYLSKVDESFDHLGKVAQIEKVVNSVKNK
jgi:hypothetical protein